MAGAVGMVIMAGGTEADPKFKKVGPVRAKEPPLEFYKDKMTCGPHRQPFFNSRALDKIW